MKRRKLEIRITTILLSVFYIIFWAALYFVGYFFAANLLFYFIALALAILTYFFVKKTSKKLGIAFSIITILITCSVFYFSFEESYCWEKGEQAEKSGSRFIIASKDDAKSLKAFGVREGTEIGSSFRTHMLCHRTFSRSEAFKDVTGLQ